MSEDSGVEDGETLIWGRGKYLKPRWMGWLPGCQTTQLKAAGADKDQVTQNAK